MTNSKVEYSDSATDDEPRKHDILCGKDKTFGNHPGNSVFREQIRFEAPRYATATKHGRMLVTKNIVSLMKKEYGSRFMLHVQNRQDGTKIWKEIDDSQARDKTSHALRFALKNMPTVTPAPMEHRVVSDGSTESTIANASFGSTTTNRDVNHSVSEALMQLASAAANVTDAPVWLEKVVNG